MDKNFNYTGSSYMRNKKLRVQEAAANFIAMDQKKKEQENKALLENEKRDLMSAAAYSSTSAYTRGRERAKRLQESLEYSDKATKATMTKYISRIVESALLIDSEEYAKLNPNYLKETEDLIRGLLDNANINENISNKKTLAILEHISRNLPKVETGILLQEADITGLVTKAENTKIEDAITDLSSNIQDKVSALVGNEQKLQQSIQWDLDKIYELTEAAKVKAVGKGKAEAEAAAEELPPEEEMPVEEEPVEEAPAAEELPPEEEYTEEPAPMEQEPMAAPAPRKETSIEIAPDGKIKIKTIAEAFIQEIPKQGLLETLAVNEGMKMVSEGKEYNGDLALANALTYITVLETFDAMGLLEFDLQKKRELIRLGGGIEYQKKDNNAIIESLEEELLTQNFFLSSNLI